MSVLATFRLLLAAVLDENLAGRPAPPEACLYLADLARELVQELAEQRRPRPHTLELVQRVAELEQKLAHLEPGERADAIQRRLHLSRSRFYRLRALAQSRCKSGLDHVESRSQVGLAASSIAP